MEEDEDWGDVEPEKGNGDGGNQEEDDGAVKGQGEELRTVGSEGLGTEGLHSQSQA